MKLSREKLNNWVGSLSCQESIFLSKILNKTFKRSDKKLKIEFMGHEFKWKFCLSLFVKKFKLFKIQIILNSKKGEDVNQKIRTVTVVTEAFKL
jgi:hypothetical protein